jgi:hypothetical protein
MNGGIVGTAFLSTAAQPRVNQTRLRLRYAARKMQSLARFKLSWIAYPASWLHPRWAFFNQFYTRRPAMKKNDNVEFIIDSSVPTNFKFEYVASFS